MCSKIPQFIYVFDDKADKTKKILNHLWIKDKYPLTYAEIVKYGRLYGE